MFNNVSLAKLAACLFKINGATNMLRVKANDHFVCGASRSAHIAINSAKLEQHFRLRPICYITAYNNYHRERYCVVVISLLYHHCFHD